MPKKRPDLPYIWANMAQKLSKFAKIRVFDTLIKNDLIVWVGNQFISLLLCFSSSFLILNDLKGSGYLEIWPKIAKKLSKYEKIKGFDTLIKIE